VVVHDSHGKLLKKLNAKDLSSTRTVSRGISVPGPGERDGGSPGEGPAAAKAAPPAARTALSPVQTINLICLVFHDIGPDSRAQAFQAAHDFLDNELRPNTIIGVSPSTIAGSILPPGSPPTAPRCSRPSAGVHGKAPT